MLGSSVRSDKSKMTKASRKVMAIPRAFGGRIEGKNNTSWLDSTKF